MDYGPRSTPGRGSAGGAALVRQVFAAEVGGLGAYGREPASARSRRSRESSASARSLYSRLSETACSRAGDSFEGTASVAAHQEDLAGRAFAVVNSDHFSLVVAWVICLNTLALIFQCDHPVWRVHFHGFRLNIWYLLNGFFLLIFTAELALRFVAFGCRGFFCAEKEWAWNLFDFSIVSMGFLDQLLVLFGHPQGGFYIVLRNLRLLRVLRVVRIFRSFKRLRALIRGLVESFSSVLWIAVFLAQVMFISAIFTTETIGQNIRDWPEDEQADMRMYWGSVAKSMLTLFQFLTMDDWKGVYEEVTEVMPWMALFFQPYIIFAAFVVMSALTGVMAEHMDQVRTAEEEEEQRQRLEDFEAAVEALEEAFVDEAAANGGEGGEPLVDRKSFPNLFSDGPVASELEAAGMEVSEREAGDLFEFFDADGDGFVSWSEFLQAMDDIHRGLTAKQVLKLTHAFQRVVRHVVERPAAAGAASPWAADPAPERWSEEALRQLQEADERTLRLESGVAALEAQARRLVEKCGDMRTGLGHPVLERCVC